MSSQILVPKQRPYDIQLIDAFCKGAYGELDYEHEAANQRRFKDAIANGPASLRDVYVPEVRLATRRVLISDWVEGERLSQRRTAHDKKTRAARRRAVLLAAARSRVLPL